MSAPVFLIEGHSAVSGPRAALSWRPLGESDLPAVTELARACLSADGGQPFAASPSFLAAWYPPGAETYAGWDGDRLACVSSLRAAAGGAADASPGRDPIGVTTGLVHPAKRRLGIGGHGFDWAAQEAQRAGRAELRAETESLNNGAHALYLSKGLYQVLAEDVMQLDARTPVPLAHAPSGLTLSHWGQADPARFYAVYQAAFRERPGFPGWPQARWVDWISDDDDFRPAWTLLASLDGADVAFVAGAATGWISQMGVVPSARGKDIGALLIAEAVRCMRSAGETSVTLNVNVNNPHAAALYRRLGFARIGRRAKYQAKA